MTSHSNPYEPPRTRLAIAAPPILSNASVLWFVGSSFVVFALGTIYQLTAGGQPFPWASRYIFFLFVMWGTESITALVLYVSGNLLFKRRYSATRLSRTAAGIIFSSIIWLGFLVVRVIIGFKWPPGIFSLPIAAAASVFADRILARLGYKISKRPLPNELVV